MKPLLRGCLAAGLGWLQAASLAWPLPSAWGLQSGQTLWALQIAALAGLVTLLRKVPTARAGASLGWAFATAWLAGTVWWLFISMHRFGGLAAPLAVLAVLALSAALALYYAAAAGLFVQFLKRNQPGVAVFWAFDALKIGVFAAAWTLAELARAMLFTGFPWGAGGYAHLQGPLAPLVPWLGVYGVGAVAAVAAGTIGLLAWRGGAVLFALGGALALLCKVLVVQPPPVVHPPVSLALLQGNIAQHEKFVRSGVQDALSWYASQLLISTASMTIAPETAVPLLPQDLPTGYLGGIQQRFSGTQTAIVGIPLERDGGYTNSSLALGAGPMHRYDKHHLVPFGEFIPPAFKWFVRLMNIPLGDFERGGLAQPAMAAHGLRWAPNICFEDLFGEELAAHFGPGGSQPHVLVNLTNMGWFGSGAAIDQHLNISRMRSLELARPMVRATNTGATVVINHQGQITHSLARAERGVLLASVQGVSGTTTPYARWVSRFGLWPLALLCGLLLLSGVLLVCRTQATRA